MTSFTITTQYDTDEETINFGTRAICEAGGFIYESTTLATVQINGEIVDKPQVVANIEHSRPCLMIRNSIAVFEDENFATIIKKYDFGDEISSYCLSSRGHFLFVTLVDGSCHCVHIPTGGQIQCMRKIKLENGNKIIKSFIDANSKSVYFVSTDTTIYRLSQFEEEKLHQSLTKGEEKKVEFLTSEIQSEKMYSGFNNRKVSYAAAGVFDDKIGIAMISKTKTYLWLSEDQTKLAILPFKLKKVQFFEECSYFMGLREDNLLHVICCRTNVLVKIYDDPVDDFMIMQDQAGGPLHICILTKNQNNAEKSDLKLMAYLDRQIIFEIPVSKMIYLVQPINCFMNDFVYLEGSFSMNHFDKILIKSLSEGNLNHRLERLIRRGKYDEAMEFAIKFGLNKRLIYQAKASMLVGRINPWVDNSNTDENVKELIQILDKIEDVQFIFECCSKILLMDCKKMRVVLIYAKNRIKQKIQKSIDPNENKDDMNLLFMMEDMLKQWDIFKILKCTSDDANENENIVEDWLKFSKANMFDECIKYLQRGQIEKACIIWSRNFTTITSNLTFDKVRRILSWIGQAATPIQLEMWFNHFVPTILFLVSDTLPDVLSWIYEKVFAMELSGAQPWPQIGIEFINNFINILKANQFRFADHFNDEVSSQKKSVQHLVQLSQALNDINRIRHDYRLAVPLEIYTSNPLNVVHLLLKNIKIDNIANFIDFFLRQYITDHSLNFDDALFLYVQKEVNASQDWWVWEEAPWERRLAVIITFFNDVEKKLRSTLLMLKKAPVPLTSTMESVIEASYNYSHNLVMEIRKEKDLIPKKTLYKKYGYQKIGLCEELICYIIKQDSDQAINDICNLTENNYELQGSAVRRYFIVHIEKGEIEKAFSILDHFNDEVCQDACKWMITFTEHSIPQKYLNIEHWIRGLNFAKAALNKIESKEKKDLRLQDERDNLIQHIKTMYQLQKEFGIKISSSDLQNNRMEKVMSDYVRNINEELVKKKIPTPAACKAILRVTDLLSLSPIFAFDLLYNQSKNNEILTFFLENENKYDWTSRLNPGDIFLYNKLFCKAIMNTDDDRIIPKIKSISSQILDSCPADDLSEAMLLVPWLNRYPMVDETLKHGNEHERCINNGTNKTMVDWKFSPTYTDAAISSNDFISFSKQALKVYLYYSDDPHQYNSEWRNHILNQDEAESWLQKLPTEVENLTAEYHDISLMHLLQCLQHKAAMTQSFPNSLCNLQSTMIASMRTLVEKVVRTLPLDMYTGLACLFALPVDEANCLLKNLFKKNRNRVKFHKAITELGCEFDLLRDNIASQYNTFRLLHQWVPRLSKYGVTSKDILENDKTLWGNLLNNVIDNYVKTEDDITDFLMLLKDICTDFWLNLQYHLQYCLGSVLKSWTPNYTVTTKEGKKEIEINKEQKTLLERRCKALAHNIEDKNDLVEYLSKIKTQINYYYYEIFLMILNLMEERKVTEYNFLYFLMQYTRVGKPAAREIENWERLTFEGCELPSISDYRLPFLKINKELWGIFESEFNLKTYKQWLLIAQALSLNKDNICVLSIKKSVDELLKCHQPSNGDWDVSQRIEVIFKEIRKCIDCMNGQDAYEMSTAVLYHVMNKVPKGTDKVLIAKECYAQAQSWVGNSSVEGEQQKKKLLEIEQQYKQLTTEQILHTHGLREKRYLDYIKRSVINEQIIMNLIMKLYDHESIPLRYTVDLTSKPDVTGAADALGQFFSINVLQLRINLLLTVIQSNRDEGQTETITKNITEIIKKCNDPEKETDLSEFDLYKASYAIKPEIKSNDTQIVQMLIGMGFGNDDLHSFGERYRAMRILQLSINEKTLKVLSKRDPNEFNNRMRTLMYLNELDELGLQLSAAEFKSLAKPEIIRLLFKRCFDTSKSQKAVDLCFGLCVDFKIYDISLWQCILEQMRKFSMISTLKKVLPAIANNCMIIYLEEFIACWQLLVDEAFQKLSSQPTHRQTNDCIETFKILQACPVVYDLNFDDSLNSCFQSKQPWMGAALIPFLCDSKKTKTLKIISDNFKTEKIVAELENLTKRGVISASISRDNYFLKNTPVL